MADKLDDLDAVRRVVETLSSFEKVDQTRILRWACEKLGLPNASQAGVLPTGGNPEPPASNSPSPQAHSFSSDAKDIKTFVAEKSPRSNNEFAATIAYYYRFEAPEPNRKESITSEDLQEACRLAGRARLSRPAQTLVNAHASGLLDKAGDRGAYSISTVGENLVAMTLPSDGAAGRHDTGAGRKKAARSRPTKKASKKKTVPNKKAKSQKRA